MYRPFVKQYINLSGELVSYENVLFYNYVSEKFTVQTLFRLSVIVDTRI
jgi:hypothetical protein